MGKKKKKKTPSGSQDDDDDDDDDVLTLAHFPGIEHLVTKQATTSPPLRLDGRNQSK